MPCAMPVLPGPLASQPMLDALEQWTALNQQWLEQMVALQSTWLQPWLALQADLLREWSRVLAEGPDWSAMTAWADPGLWQRGAEQLA